ncbi:hypothetical protein Nepgr_028151 [Nepenthes gracilis]|uniref:Glycosyltransferase n=1 Tax=Nepenthes gracilis TaxID=150966 RepID=A0AAD3Y252_NEPGR|nr:hypothetical protein Nepgr_028151 [Nepenthes gracilis]
MSSEARRLHFMLFPLMAQGHMNPMIDIAKLIAKQGLIVTLVTTPLNALRFRSTTDRAIEAGLDIRVTLLKFPSKESGLPEGCENLDMLPSLGLVMNFMIACGKLQEPLEQALREMNPPPDCIISDMGFPWTTQVAREFNVPRIAFHGTCCFSLVCSHNIRSFKLLDTIASDSELIAVPGIPDRIEVTRVQLPNSLSRSSPDLDEIRNKILEADEESFGAVVNSFEELEPEYAKLYKEAKGRVWCVGPASLCNKDEIDKAARGNKAALEDENRWLKWLDSFEEGSVVYACLGSLCPLMPSQMIELGQGLEASNRPFVWVARGKNLDELEKWMEEDGFEERIKGRGLVIRRWAPQVLILSHPAIGAFLTHCGWNSMIEGVCAGLPMATWPMFAEQFLNEKLAVQVLKIGVGVGAKVRVQWGEEDEMGVLVKKEDVKRAIEMVMDEGGEGKERRRRARELGEMARKAAEGGSSYRNLKSLIQEIGKRQQYLQNHV